MVFSHWRNANLTFELGGLRLASEPQRVPVTVQKRYDDENSVLTRPNNQKSIELTVLPPKPSLRKKKRILNKIEGKANSKPNELMADSREFEDEL